MDRGNYGDVVTWNMGTEIVGTGNGWDLECVH